MVRRLLSKIKEIGLHSFKNENVRKEIYRRLLRYYAFPKLLDYSERTIISIEWCSFVLLRSFVSVFWTKSTATVE